MNLFVFYGTVYEEIQLSKTNNGLSFCNIPLKIVQKRKKKEEWVEEEILVPKITVWGKRAENISDLSVGTPLIIKGRVTCNEYQGKYYNNFTAEDVQIIGTGGKAENKADNDDENIPF